MAENIEKQKAELEKLEKLVDGYAQSRSLGLLIPIALLALNAALLIGSMELVGWKPTKWTLAILFLSIFWVVIGSMWVTFKLIRRYGYSFYDKDGKIELQEEKIPIWAWAAYCITFLTPAIFSELNKISVQWALTIALLSFGFFIVYVSKKQKEMALGIVGGGLFLIEAIATAAGVPVPWTGKHSYFVSLMIYIVGAGFITAIVVHLYNRRILKKIKKTRSFDE
jgi:hypothetical protein